MNVTENNQNTIEPASMPKRNRSSELSEGQTAGGLMKMIKSSAKWAFSEKSYRSAVANSLEKLNCKMKNLVWLAKLHSFCILHF